jgi:hypothetical protein
MRGCRPDPVNLEISSNFQGGAVRLGRVVDKIAAKADGIGNQLRKFGNRKVFARADIDPFRVRPGLEQEYRGVGDIVDMTDPGCYLPTGGELAIEPSLEGLAAPNSAARLG